LERLFEGFRQFRASLVIDAERRFLRLINPFGDAEFAENYRNLSSGKDATANRPFQFDKYSQLFIRVHNETLSVARIALESFLIGGWQMMIRLREHSFS
jgi:hypothetical protein